jgi:lipoprotein-anchoring transpeptidase ErfK/SrfK
MPGAARVARRVATVTAIPLVIALLASGCGSQPEGQATPLRRSQPTRSSTTIAVATTTSETAPATGESFDSYAAVVNRPSIDIRHDPTDPRPFLTLDRTNENGAPQTFLIRETRADWYHVLLPVRPNGSTGWVRAADVDVVGLPYHLVVDTTAYRLDLYEGITLRRSIHIGVGTDQTPTPGGLYYIKELLRPPDQDTVYGHYVFGLSGFSNVLVDWPGGGVLGIHGTNDPGHSLGRQVSHGCVRMDNDDIEYLASILPLGTPVEIRA